MAAVVFLSNFVFLIFAGIISAAIISAAPNISPIIPVVISYIALVFSTWYAVLFIEKRSKITERNIIPVALMAIAPVVASQIFAIGASVNQLLSDSLLTINLGIGVSNLVIAFFTRDAITILSVYIFMRSVIKKD